MQSKEIRLKNRPVGVPTTADFELATVEVPEPGPGEALVRNLWMTVDPYMRGQMVDRKSYIAPFALGKPLTGLAVGEVLESNDPGLAKGELVITFNGWREAFVGKAAAMQKPPPIKAPPEAFLGVLGSTGITAYGGLLRIIDPKEGETIFVSGAAGAVGSIAAQIAKIKGCRVIASAGTDEKVAWLKSVGVDHAVNYKTCGDLAKALAVGAPDGIDGYFDNVGGAHLEAALELARPFARFAECGMIAQYNLTEPPPGPRNLVLLISKSIRMEGFLLGNMRGIRPPFFKDMEAWIAEGKIKWEETVAHGIENAPTAFLSLFSGGNIGKMLVKLS
ncbi:MAG: NADP-dependent oxidoreductase [Hyphomonadaceae bacterium]